MAEGGACLLDSNILLRIGKSRDPQHTAIRGALMLITLGRSAPPGSADTAECYSA